jgi:hypothetical protein
MFEVRDREILRDLAGRVAEIAELEVQAERRELWKRHNSLKALRPMLLVFPRAVDRADPLPRCAASTASRASSSSSSASASTITTTSATTP